MLPVGDGGEGERVAGAGREKESETVISNWAYFSSCY